MKKLIIGLGGCGNNILNLLQDKNNMSLSKTVSIQRDLQLLAISNADFKLSAKDKDFEKNFNILLENSNNISLIVGLGGTTSILYLDKIIKKFEKSNKEFRIFFITPSKVEGLSKQKKANEILNKLKNYKIFFRVFNNDSSIKDTDDRIIELLNY